MIIDRLNALALRALEEPQTYATPRRGTATPWELVQEAVDSLNRFVEAPVRNPAWDMPRLTGELITWADEDSAGYAEFMTKVAPEVSERTLATLPGLWRLYSVINALSDDHDYVLEATDTHFGLARQDAVAWQPLVGPTELADRIRAHRGLPALPQTAVPVPKGRRARQ